MKESSRPMALIRLKQRYSVAELDGLMDNMTELRRTADHPSVDAAYRLLLQARNQKSKAQE